MLKWGSDRTSPVAEAGPEDEKMMMKMRCLMQRRLMPSSAFLLVTLGCKQQFLHSKLCSAKHTKDNKEKNIQRLKTSSRSCPVFWEDFFFLDTEGIQPQQHQIIWSITVNYQQSAVYIKLNCLIKHQEGRSSPHQPFCEGFIFINLGQII